MNKSPSVWLIGAGPMAQSYAAVLQAQSIDFQVIGRSTASANAFQNATGKQVVGGGIDEALTVLNAPTKAIVAVSVEQLAYVAQRLIRAGCKRLLLEKPGALHLSDLAAINSSGQSAGAKVWIAYNRRFYGSVQKLRQLTTADGGITSMAFEFTEWSHRIRDLQKAPSVKEHWLLANSTHVIDLAFHLIGLPAKEQWQSWNSGSLDWHTASARFHGAGITEQAIPFTYHADWEAPGRWGLELLTKQNRYVLRPMEALETITLGSLKAKPIKLDNTLDQEFKPGLFLQCQAFFSEENKLLNQLCSLEEQLRAFPIYYQIAGYTQ